MAYFVVSWMLNFCFSVNSHEINWLVDTSTQHRFWVFMFRLFASFKAQFHHPDCMQTKLNTTLLYSQHLTAADNIHLDAHKHSKQTVSKIRRGGDKCTNSRDAHWTHIRSTQVQRWEESSRQRLIIYWSIYSFCQDTFPHCPEVLHKEVMVTCPICFEQKTGKKGKSSMWSWKQTHIQRCSPRRQQHYMFPMVSWFVEANLICQSLIRSPKDFPHVPLESLSFFS